jgi:hypothetical protein
MTLTVRKNNLPAQFLRHTPWNEKPQIYRSPENPSLEAALNHLFRPQKHHQEDLFWRGSGAQRGNYPTSGWQRRRQRLV